MFTDIISGITLHLQIWVQSLNMILYILTAATRGAFDMIFK